MVTNSQGKQPGINLWNELRRLLRLSGPNRIWFFIALVAAILEVAITIGWNLGLARFIDAVSTRHTDDFVNNLVFIIIMFAIGMPSSALRTYGIGRFSETTIATLRERFAVQATALPMSVLEQRHTGDLLAVVNADLAKMKALTASLLIDVVYQSLMGLAALVVLFILSWQLALVSTILIPVMIVVMSRLNAPIAKRSEEMQAAVGATIGIAQDGLAGLMVTRAFNLAAVMDERFGAANRNTMHKGLLLARLRAVTDGGGTLFSFIPFLVTFGFGGYLAINGLMTFGSLMSFINLLNFVANPLSQLPPALAGISEGFGAAQRLFAILETVPERYDGRSFAPDGTVDAVQYEHVGFTYDTETSTKLTLQDVTARIAQGQTVAIVGGSGGGKSTLLKLLLGYYPVGQGSIRLFGHDLNEWSLRAARTQMAFVAQDTYLFPVSIAQNIACGKPGAEPSEVERAARMANIHDFIAQLPEGYQTLVGERGARLSGGQRQRIALARAILKDAPILLLDEPTSALDTESESLVQEALERFMVGRTTIVVAHRLSTIRRANHVLVLEEGQIVEEGTHEALMARAGRYRELYMRQFEDATPVAVVQQ
ncbi:MAG TPA: ABC transporter ATP-binding protein [Anaerolineae bacterium]|jgi:ABC-type multidrug transport system fused ATPase/permease subunit